MSRMDPQATYACMIPTVLGEAYYVWWNDNISAVQAIAGKNYYLDSVEDAGLAVRR